MYAKSDLQQLIDTQQQYRIESRAKLRHHYQEFCCIRKFLLDKQHLSNIEQNKMSMQGFNKQLQEKVKSRLHVKFLDHYHNEWQDFHKCVHFPPAGTTAKSYFGTITQAHVPTIFAIPPAVSTPPPATVIVKIMIFSSMPLLLPHQSSH
jgi:hypothetical protein